jgi:hypothetical protein
MCLNRCKVTLSHQVTLVSAVVCDRPKRSRDAVASSSEVNVSDGQKKGTK